ncbi:hypothetical protein [Longimicrobium sp.]|uniref:hypothetical protein n=1 Tax=Longimicrobium sp. TaxID=2029185 RepID=UPI003B3B9A10
MTFEEMAVERDRELERQRAAAEGESPYEHRDAFGAPPSASMVCETAAVTWGFEAIPGGDYSTGVTRLISHLWFILYTIGEQRQEIVRLRENTRQVLGRLAPA